MLKFKNINIAYQNKNILNDVNLTIKPGKISSVVGTNGCGKSTLVKSLFEPEMIKSGELKYFNQNIETSKRFKREVVILSQVNYFPGHLKVREYLELTKFKGNSLFKFKIKSNDDDISKAIQLTGIESLLDRHMGDLSGGQRQKVFIAFCLAQKPKLLILDEPATYLDIHAQIQLMKMIREIVDNQSLSVILIHHDLEQVLNFSDQLILIDKGTVSFDNNLDAIKNFDFLKRAFNVDFKVISREDSGYHMHFNYKGGRYESSSNI